VPITPIGFSVGPMADGSAVKLETMDQGVMGRCSYFITKEIADRAFYVVIFIG
jgi:hypothetical protein